MKTHKTKVVTIVGARPQFVKAAVVSSALQATNSFCEIMVHTGQHYDENLSAVFFSDLGMKPPAYNLAIGSGGHGRQTGRMLEKLEQLLVKEQPQWVIVYGDTNSTLAGALAAAKLQIPIAHVEAGLRSYNRIMPEEINRVLTDHLSDLLLAPTESARQNLAREGIDGPRVKVVGDVMYDAALSYSRKAAEKSKILDRLTLEANNYIVATVHRAENTTCEKRLSVIFEALSQTATQLRVIMPIHPRTRKILEQTQALIHASRHIELIEPLGYLDMMMLLKNGRVVVTDSGGVQKEAFFCSVPCVTLRTETEWVELIRIGWNRLAPPHDTATVMCALHSALEEVAPPTVSNLYGDGHAADCIAQHLLYSDVPKRRLTMPRSDQTTDHEEIASHFPNNDHTEI